MQTENDSIDRKDDAQTLTPISKIQALYQIGLESFSSDFMADGRPEQIPTKREELFSDLHF